MDAFFLATTESFRLMMKDHDKVVRDIRSWGSQAVKYARVFSCALCGDRCRILEACTECEGYAGLACALQRVQR